MALSPTTDHWPPDLLPYLEKIATELATTVGNIYSLELNYTKDEREKITVGLCSSNKEYVFKLCADGVFRRPDNRT